MVEKGIFRTERRAWAAVAVYTVFLYSTLTIAFDIYVYFFDRMGKPFMSKVMSWMYLPIGLVLLLFLVLYLPRRFGAYLAFLIISLALLYCLRFLDVPAKRFHFLQYGPLTVLVFDALRFRSQSRYLYVYTLALVSLIGLGDEVLQALLPRRTFGLIDVVVNSAAGALTLAFIGFVMGEENYPFGKTTKTPRAQR